MRVRDLLFELSERGVTLRCGRTENRLNAGPAAALTPKLVAEIKEHRAEIIAVVREDGRLEETGMIQTERQVFEVAREFLSENEGEVQRGRQDRSSSPGATPTSTMRGRRQKRGRGAARAAGGGSRAAVSQSTLFEDGDDRARRGRARRTRDEGIRPEALLRRDSVAPAERKARSDIPRNANNETAKPHGEERIEWQNTTKPDTDRG